MEPNFKTNEINELKKNFKKESLQYLEDFCGFEKEEVQDEKHPVIKRKLIDGKHLVKNNALFDLKCQKQAKMLFGKDFADKDGNLPEIIIVAVKASKMFTFDGEDLTPDEILQRYDSSFLLILSGTVI